MNSNLILSVSTIANSPVLIEVGAGRALIADRRRLVRHQRPLRPLTGCSSPLSACPSALATFSWAVAQYFAACALENPVLPLAPDEQRPAPYAPSQPAPQGCLSGDDYIASLAALPAVTDEEIEQCGYLGWFRH